MSRADYLSKWTPKWLGFLRLSRAENAYAAVPAVKLASADFTFQGKMLLTFE